MWTARQKYNLFKESTISFQSKHKNIVLYITLYKVIFIYNVYFTLFV